jgi:hypothetical protein
MQLFPLLFSALKARLAARIPVMDQGGAEKKKAAKEPAPIRLSAISFALALTTAALAVGASRWCLQMRSADLAQAQQLRDAAFAKFSQVDQEIEEIRLYQPQFLQLRARGRLGAENRLAWTEAMRQSQEQRRLLPISYEIEPQQAFQLDPPALAGAYQLHGSLMTLHMDLLHEMDLFDFLDDLRAHANIAVRDCAIKRGTMAPQTTAVAPLLSANCTLYWLTLDADGALPRTPPLERR